MSEEQHEFVVAGFIYFGCVAFGVVAGWFIGSCLGLI